MLEVPTYFRENVLGNRVIDFELYLPHENSIASELAIRLTALQLCPILFVTVF